MAERRLSIERQNHIYRAVFRSMGCPCEVLCEVDSAAEAEQLSSVAAQEAWRVEDKYSRYLRGNIVARINSANDQPIVVDDETAKLLEFAHSLYALSEYSFDITSGVLRKVWTFDGSDNVPTDQQVGQILLFVGWSKVSWNSPRIQMPAGMEVDLGGLGKEYAVDSAIGLLLARSRAPCLVNFGGDLAVTGPPAKSHAWVVGIEGLGEGAAEKLIELRRGALATSGDSKRYLLKAGIRYSHVLDPRTGFPVRGAASSITVAADTCTQAGMISTLAMLKGHGAEEFLSSQNEKYWCRRASNC